MSAEAAVDVQGLSYCYGSRTALADVSLAVQPGEIFAFLGPNGSGKTTLFRILSTLLPLGEQGGSVRIFGRDLAEQVGWIRRRLGVVFQAPSLDRKLTVLENIRQQAALYGLWGEELKRRQAEVLHQLGLAERGQERTETLSGGLRRRVELAKSLIHRPQLLLMDEPSTGLDPAARSDLWKYLRSLQTRTGVTIVLTTHLLDEADRADRLAILHQGRLVALDRPDCLRASLGGDLITIQASDPRQLVAQLHEQLGLTAQIVEGRVRLDHVAGPEVLPRIASAFHEQIDSITLGKPTLEDVFIAKTGHRFWSQPPTAA